MIKRILITAILLLIPALCWAGWDSHFDNTEWTVVKGSWDGSKWVSGSGDQTGWIVLQPTGDWHVGYRPTKIRVTISATVETFVISDSDSNSIYPLNHYISLSEESLTWYDSGILEFDMYLAEGFNITNIEFYLPDSWLHNFMGVSNANIGYISGVSIEDIQSVGRVQ